MEKYQNNVCFVFYDVLQFEAYKQNCVLLRITLYFNNINQVNVWDCSHVIIKAM